MNFHKFIIGWFMRQALLKHHKIRKYYVQSKLVVDVNKKPALKIYAEYNTYKLR